MQPDKPPLIRGTPPKPNAGSGMFTIRTYPAEQRRITQYARLQLRKSANEFVLSAARQLMPDGWISQGEGRPQRCSRCGVKDSDLQASQISKADHEQACWHQPRFHLATIKRRIEDEFDALHGVFQVESDQNRLQRSRAALIAALDEIEATLNQKIQFTD